MLVFTGMVLLAITAEVGARPNILPNGEVLQVEDEFAAVRNSADPMLRRKKYMLKNKEKLWGGAVVTFKMRDLMWISAQHPYRTVHDAMRDIMQKTCVRFKERSGEADYVYIEYEFSQASSHSDLGRKGGMQVLNIHGGAFDKRTVLHELGHVLGLEDEHSRPDRDHYIKVIKANLAGGTSEVFELVDREKTNLLGEPFDYKSIMMYHDTAYSSDPKNLKTLVSKTEHRVPTEPTTQLSPGDIRRINDLYRCEGIDQKPKFPFDVACSFDDNSCGFKGLRRFERRQRVWERKKKPYPGFSTTEPDGGYLIWSVNPVKKLTTEDHIWSVGFYGTRPHHSIRGQEGCVKFKYSFNTGGKGRHTLKVSR
nr:PREDICTED: astacin-like metalloprotease toxin 2 [Bemisia tabaci]